MSVAAKVKNYGKKAINYPDDEVPVITAKDWVKSLSSDPVRDVRLCSQM